MIPSDEPTAWVLAIDIDDGPDERGRQQSHVEYWQGKPGDNGEPSRSLFRCDAFHFKTSEEARVCTETHPALKDSDDWRIVPADQRRSLRRTGS